MSATRSQKTIPIGDVFCYFLVATIAFYQMANRWYEILHYRAITLGLVGVQWQLVVATANAAPVIASVAGSTTHLLVLGKSQHCWCQRGLLN